MNEENNTYLLQHLIGSNLVFCFPHPPLLSGGTYTCHTSPLSGACGAAHVLSGTNVLCMRVGGLPALMATRVYVDCSLILALLLGYCVHAYSLWKIYSEHKGAGHSGSTLLIALPSHSLRWILLTLRRV